MFMFFFFILYSNLLPAHCVRVELSGRGITAADVTAGWWCTVETGKKAKWREVKGLPSQ